MNFPVASTDVVIVVPATLTMTPTGGPASGRVAAVEAVSPLVEPPNEPAIVAPVDDVGPEGVGDGLDGPEPEQAPARNAMGTIEIRSLRT
jgi:hypothetical protein